MRSGFSSRVSAFASIFLMLSAYPSHLVHAQQPATSLVVYDSFDERFLDPAKWLGSPFGACLTVTVLECVREIQDERLRLAVRNYGATDSNQGFQYGPSELHFTNPNPVRTIATRLVIRRAAAVSCPTNSGGSSHAQALVTGRFFNSGSGQADDDVEAFLAFDHYSSDPDGVANALAFMHWRGQFFGGIGLGAINVGQKVIAELSWDQPNSQFVASWTDVLTGTVTRAVLPYTMPATMLPAASDKLLGVRTFAPNCFGMQRTFADMEVAFSKVWTGN